MIRRIFPEDPLDVGEYGGCAFSLPLEANLHIEHRRRPVFDTFNTHVWREPAF